MLVAIETAPDVAALDVAVSAVYRTFGAGLIGWPEVEAFQAAADARRSVLTARRRVFAPAPRRPTVFPVRGRQRSPDRAASRARRRRLSLAGALPPGLRELFTEGERAALKIVADEICGRGHCELPLAAIAARAGVCRSTVQHALRVAARHGLIAIQRRPRPGLPNLPNVVRVLSREWRTWLERGRTGGGCKRFALTETHLSKRGGEGLSGIKKPRRPIAADAGAKREETPKKGSDASATRHREKEARRIRGRAQPG